MCDIFKPKKHHDQLCYETDLQLLKDSKNENLVNQLEMGFTLVLDYNEERHLDSNLDLENKSSVKEEVAFNYNNLDGKSLSIYLDTISRNHLLIYFYLPKFN